MSLFISSPQQSIQCSWFGGVSIIFRETNSLSNDIMTAKYPYVLAHIERLREDRQFYDWSPPQPL